MLKKIVVLLIVIFSVNSAEAQFTAEAMCEKIPEFYRAEELPVHIFFDAYEHGGLFAQGRIKNEFYSFQIVREDILLTKLGELFDDDIITEGNVTTVYEIPYNYIGLSNGGRMLTRIFNFPRRGSPNPSRSPWALYKLCRYDQCHGHHLSNGEWYEITTNVDATPVKQGDVFAFYYRRNRVPPTIVNCSRKLEHSEHEPGELDRH